MSKVNYLVKFFSLPSRCLEISLAILLLTVGIYNSEARPVSPNELQISAKSQVLARAEAFGEDKAITLRGKLPEVDGVYLYGQSSEPEQIGEEYMVFEVRQGKVTGALYLPYSEFSCFQGTMESGKLALMVATGPTDSYSDPVAGQNPQRVATANDSSRIGNGYNSMAYPYSVALQNYYQLTPLSASAQQILKNCQSNRHE